MKKIIKRTIILTTIFLLITSSVVIQAQKEKKVTTPQQAKVSQDNTLGEITVEWPNPILDRRIRPIVYTNQSSTRDFYFPVVDNVLQINLTVICKVRLEHKVLLPRWTEFTITLYHNGKAVVDHDTQYYYVNGLTYSYFNFTTSPDDYLLSPGNQTITFSVFARVTGLPFGFVFPKPIPWADITVHPI